MTRGTPGTTTRSVALVLAALLVVAISAGISQVFARSAALPVDVNLDGTAAAPVLAWALEIRPAAPEAGWSSTGLPRRQPRAVSRNRDARRGYAPPIGGLLGATVT